MDTIQDPAQTRQSTAQEALTRTQEALQHFTFDNNTIYYTFADKSIVPTFLPSGISRREVNSAQGFTTLQGDNVQLFPAFGASMSFMRARFARDLQLLDLPLVAGQHETNALGGVHILPRVGLSAEERLDDIVQSNPAYVGTALGIHEDDAFLHALLDTPNLIFLSIDIAHGANAAALEILHKLRVLGVRSGVILGNVGSVEGFIYAYWLMKLSGFDTFSIKVGVGPGSVCTTRINTGVGVGQFTLLEQIRQAKEHLGYSDVQIISDGGVNAAGDFVKALALADGVMMGKFFASGSFEEDVLLRSDKGELTGVQLFGMASAMVTEKRNFIEGSQQTLKAFHHDAAEAVQRLREGLQSAMTYVGAHDLEMFRSSVRFATNSSATITESGVH